MAEFLNPIAELGSADSGKIVSPAEAYALKKDYDFFCPDYNCRDEERRLFIKKSKNNNYFFSHHGNCGHDILPETLLHKSAIRWFIDKEQFEVPSGYPGHEGTIYLNKDKTQPEFRNLKTFIPDVKLTSTEGFQFAVEIVVTSDITHEKKLLIKKVGLPTLRLDLQSFYYNNPNECRVDLKFINDHLHGLLTDINLKSWVNLPLVQSIIIFSDSEQAENISTDIFNQPSILEPANSNNGCVLIMLVLGLGIFGIKILHSLI